MQQEVVGPGAAFDAACKHTFSTNYILGLYILLNIATQKPFKDIFVHFFIVFSGGIAEFYLVYCCKSKSCVAEHGAAPFITFL